MPSPSVLWHRTTTIIAALSVAAILLHVAFRFGFHTAPGTYQNPLLAVQNALRAAFPPKVIYDL